MSALDQAVCPLAKMHPQMWGCTSCGYQVSPDQLLDQAPVHRSPPVDAAVTPCCRRTPFELPGWHRMTTDPTAVTCEGPTVPGARSATHPTT